MVNWRCVMCGLADVEMVGTESHIELKHGEPIHVSGVEVRRCPKCHELETSIPKIMALIAAWQQSRATRFRFRNGRWRVVPDPNAIL